jgi:hypothetical protein
VAEAILGQSTITASQLASQMLLAIKSRGGGILTKARLLEHVTEEANRWTKAGLYVDPRLLTREEQVRRLDEYVEYCLRSGELIAREAGGFWVPRAPERVSANYANPGGAINYINNELTSLTRLLRNVTLNNTS